MAHAQRTAARGLEVGAAGDRWSSRVWRALFACATCWLVLFASACTGGPHPEPPFMDPNAAQGGTGFGNEPPPIIGTGGMGGGGGAGGAGGSAGMEVAVPLEDAGEDNVDDDDAGIADDDAGALH